MNDTLDHGPTLHNQLQWALCTKDKWCVSFEHSQAIQWIRAGLFVCLFCHRFFICFLVFCSTRIFRICQLIKFVLKCWFKWRTNIWKYIFNGIRYTYMYVFIRDTDIWLSCIWTQLKHGRAVWQLNFRFNHDLTIDKCFEIRNLILCVAHPKNVCILNWFHIDMINGMDYANVNVCCLHTIWTDNYVLI